MELMLTFYFHCLKNILCSYVHDSPHPPTHTHHTHTHTHTHTLTQVGNGFEELKGHMRKGTDFCKDLESLLADRYET